MFAPFKKDVHTFKNYADVILKHVHHVLKSVNVYFKTFSTCILRKSSSCILKNFLNMYLKNVPHVFKKSLMCIKKMFYMYLEFFQYVLKMFIVHLTNVQCI